MCVMETRHPYLIPAQLYLLRSWKTELRYGGKGVRGGIKTQRHISAGGTVSLDVLGVADLMKMESLQCWTCLRAFLASRTSVTRDEKIMSRGRQHAKV